MGFYLYIEDEKREWYRDERWEGGKYSYAREVWDLICSHCTDQQPGDEIGDGPLVRPRNASEVASLRAAIELWPDGRNRELYLHAVDVVAKNPNLRFVPSY